MSERSVYFYFSVIPVRSLHKQFVPFSQVLVNECNFRLVSYKSNNDSISNLSSISMVDDVETFVHQEIEEMIRGSGSSTDFQYWFNGDGAFSIHVLLDTQYQFVMLTIDRNFFLTKETVEIIMQVCEKIYYIFQTPYGYGPTGATDIPILDKDKSTISTLYMHNFFGPELTLILGKEKLFSISSWQTKELDNGGIFIAMEFDPFQDMKKTSQEWSDAIETLELSQYKRHP